MSKAWAIGFLLSALGTVAIGLTSNYFDYFPGKCIALGLAVINPIVWLVLLMKTKRSRPALD